MMGHVLAQLYNLQNTFSFDVLPFLSPHKIGSDRTYCFASQSVHKKLSSSSETAVAASESRRIIFQCAPVILHDQTTEAKYEYIIFN